MMILLPKATKTRLAKLVRSKGYDLPSIRQAYFEKPGRSRGYFLFWEDSKGARHRAYYTGILGQPVLNVDKDVCDLTLAEAIHFGLVEEKNSPAGGEAPAGQPKAKR